MNITQEFETIAAIATPLGTGGVGVIRISGDTAFEIINKIFSKQNLEAGKIAHGWIHDNGKKIDEVLVLPFRTPHSYTGEDVIEIHCHGGVNVVRNILDLTLKNHLMRRNLAELQNLGDTLAHFHVIVPHFRASVDQLLRLLALLPPL